MFIFFGAVPQHHPLLSSETSEGIVKLSILVQLFVDPNLLKNHNQKVLLHEFAGHELQFLCSQFQLMRKLLLQLFQDLNHLVFRPFKPSPILVTFERMLYDIYIFENTFLLKIS